MTEREPNLLISSLSGPVTRDDVTVEVDIYRLEHDPTWSLEVVNGAGTLSHPLIFQTIAKV